jgi:hypothetical protein
MPQGMCSSSLQQMVSEKSAYNFLELHLEHFFIYWHMCSFPIVAISNESSLINLGFSSLAMGLSTLVWCKSNSR